MADGSVEEARQKERRQGPFLQAHNTMATGSTIVRIGDYVTIKSNKHKKNVSAEGLLDDFIYMFDDGNSFENCWFQICLPRQYSAAKELEEFIEKEKIGKTGTKPDADVEAHIKALRRGEMNERKINDSYMTSKYGSELRYGDVIQLLHVKSKKFINVVGKSVARAEKENIRVSLHETGTPNSWFIIQPRFKINRNGDFVFSNTEIVLRVAERNNEYLHCADRLLELYPREINASLEATSWVLNVFQSSLSTDDANALLTSQLIYLHDPETLSNLSIFTRPPCISTEDDESDMSEDDSMMALSANGEVIIDPMGNTLSSNALWMLELKNPALGGVVQWKTELVRLKHVNSGKYFTMIDIFDTFIGKYLCMIKNPHAESDFDPHLLTVSSNPHDRGTLFSLHELHSTGAYLMNQHPVQLSHGNTYLERSDFREIANTTHYVCKGNKSRAQAVNLFITRYELETNIREVCDTPLDIFVGISILRFLNEAYRSMCSDNEIQLLSPDDEASFNAHMALAIAHVEHMQPSVDGVSDDIVSETLREQALVRFSRQSMLREQGTLNIVLMYLHAMVHMFDNHDDDVTEIDSDIDDETIASRKLTQYTIKQCDRICDKLLKFLLSAIHNHAENQLCVAEHMHVVLGFVRTHSVAADVVTAMLKDNVELQQHKIGPREIRIFVEQLASPDSKLNPMYFGMLRAFCSCSGKGIARNQGFIIDDLFPVVDRVFARFHVNEKGPPEKPPLLTSSESVLYLPQDVSASDSNKYGILGLESRTQGTGDIFVSWNVAAREYKCSTLYQQDHVALVDLFDYDVLYVPQEELIRRKTVGMYVIAQLHLVAEICLDRNYVAIPVFESVLPYDLLLTILEMPHLPSALRSAAARVITNLYVDRVSETTGSMPCLSRLWSSAKQNVTVATVEEDHLYRFALLQKFIGTYLVQLRRVSSWDDLALHVVAMLHKLVVLQFYGSLNKMRDVIQAIMGLFNRKSTDSSRLIQHSMSFLGRPVTPITEIFLHPQKSFTNISHAVRKSLVSKSSPRKLEFAKSWIPHSRYLSTPLYELQTYVEMVDVLHSMQRILDDRNVSLLLNGFYTWYIENSSAVNEKVIKDVFVGVHEQMQELRISSDTDDDTLIDLIMYDHAPLVQSVLDVLIAHHSATRSMLDNVGRLQILVTKRREKQFSYISASLLKLDRHIETHALWKKLSNDDQRATQEECLTMLRAFESHLKIRRRVLEFDEEFEPDVTIQNMLHNLGFFDVACKAFTKLSSMATAEVTMSDEIRNARIIMSAINDVLYWYTMNNAVNQAEVFTRLDFFLQEVDSNIRSHRVVSAIFKNNETLMRRVPMHYVAQFAERICKQGRFPQYLTLMSAITHVGAKNILENQYEIIKQLSSPLRLKRVLVYFCSDSHHDYQRKIKLMAPYMNKKDPSSDEIAAELSYHLELLRTLSGCTVGYNSITTIETKVQGMFNYVDLLKCFVDPHCLMLVRIEYGIFFFNAVLEVEIPLPGLVYSQSVWSTLQHCAEVFAGGRDLLRQAERHGFDAPNVSRQSVEYVVVCVMIVYAFFKRYFDLAVFTREFNNIPAKGDKVSLSMKQIHELISSLFEKIQVLYELDSPVLAQSHKAYIYNALDTLCKIKNIKLAPELRKSMISDMTGTTQSGKPTESIIHSHLKVFLSNLHNNMTVKEVLEEEFQSIISRIENIPRVADTLATRNVRYEPFIAKLVKHVKASIHVEQQHNSIKKSLNARCTASSIWMVRLFRTMIENRWGMTIYERDEDGGEEQDLASADLVDTFNACGATTLLLDLISVGMDATLVLESIKLCVAMLFKEGGAIMVQQTMYAHLSSTKSELFFQQLRNMIQKLMMWHEWQSVASKSSGEVAELPDELIVVRFMQLMCEGHYIDNQDIMREQPNNNISINLLDDLASYLVCLGHIPCATSTTAALSVFATCLEVIQGPCAQNQEYFAINTHLIESLNRQMRCRPFEECNLTDEITLKKIGIDIFQGLLEGQGQKTLVYDRMLSIVHLDVIQLMCRLTKTEISDQAEESEEDELDEALETLRTESLVLLQILCDFKPDLRDELEVLHDMGKDNRVVSVEVMWRGELQRRFFNIPKICMDVSRRSRNDLVENIDRSSQEKKLLEFYRRSSVIYTEIKHQQVLKEWNISGVFSPKNQNRATWITFWLACIINMLYVAYYDGSDCLQPEEIGPDGAHCGAPSLPMHIRPVVDALNYIQLISSSFTFILFTIVRVPVVFRTNLAKGDSRVQCMINTLMDPLTLYYLCYVVFTSAGIEYDVLITFLLLDIIVKNNYAMDVIIAIVYPFKQLLMAIGLLLIFMYIFAMTLFLFYNSSKHILYPSSCNTLYHCFIFVVYDGRSADFGPFLTQLIDEKSWILYTIFDLAVRFILFNVIQGITVDTFSELRLAKLEKHRNTTDTCFICSIDKQVFDRDQDSHGFAHHIKHEHHMWNYLYYMVYLWEQDKDDDDGLEQYVRRCIDANEISWFPINCAMCLGTQEEDGMEVTKREYMQHIDHLEQCFVAKLTAIQSEVNSSVAAIAASMTEKETTNEYLSPVLMARAKSFKDFALVRSRKDENVIHVELVEIRGLEFARGVLESMYCCVRFKGYKLIVNVARIMQVEMAGTIQSIHLMALNDIPVPTVEASDDDLLRVQVAYGSPGRFLGVVDFSLAELKMLNVDRKEKSFQCKVHDTMSRGTIVINVRHMSDIFVNDIEE